MFYLNIFIGIRGDDFNANITVALRDERGGGGGGMDGPVGAGGPDVVANSGPPPTGERRKLKLAPRSKQPAGPAATSGPGPAPASAKKASIFGGGKAHDEFAYEVCVFVYVLPRSVVNTRGAKGNSKIRFFSVEVLLRKR